MYSMITTFYSNDDELKLGTAESSNIRALALDLENLFMPIVVQFRSGGTYSYSVTHICVPGTDVSISNDKQAIVDFYNMLVRGGYTKAQLSAGIPGHRSSTGALVSSLLVQPARISKALYKLPAAIVADVEQ